jgi:hypothetical protein
MSHSLSVSPTLARYRPHVIVLPFHANTCRKKGNTESKTQSIDRSISLLSSLYDVIRSDPTHIIIFVFFVALELPNQSSKAYKPSMLLLSSFLSYDHIYALTSSSSFFFFAFGVLRNRADGWLVDQTSN